ncbi:GGDEF domain-containing protein [Dechloromonas sp. XY25]|uniref:diguanylate cyclase n=1 Tax=Dechloromonas hankyongensis TaxID=2908002 RepID=A0ABS9K4H2_9RHOO|nr:GGDEF domain-containing protein [Dechloromonas hankyongensis]MCG2578058.1 GGDEF domain-containing protein [Dechloromonas hankyongensis]
MPSAKVISFPARQLIAFARDLLQAADLASIVEQVGPTMKELLSPDSALIVAKIEGNDFAAAFGCRGTVVPVHVAQDLFAVVQNTPRDGGRIILPDVELPRTAERDAGLRGSILSISFPLEQPWGTLSVLWQSVQEASRLEVCEEILGAMAELTGAAMGNIVNKMMLEEKAAATEEVSKAVTEELVQELKRNELEVREKHHVAITDVLTGLLNRRGFYERAEQGLRLARRQGIECAVIYADLDGLKGINDKYGHVAGDACLRAAAQVFQDSFRESDVVARLGGDEFAAFSMDATNTEVIVARLVQKANESYELGELTHPVSFSIGVIGCDPASEQPLAEFLSMADQAMYEQKRKRRHKH